MVAADGPADLAGAGDSGSSEGGGGTPAAFGCPSDEALVACYGFDGESGDQVLDGSGKGNHGRIVGPMRTPGVHGMGLYFSGGNQVVRVPHHPSLNLVGSNATIEAWVRPATYPTTEGLDHVVAKQSAADTNGYALGLYHQGQFGGYSGSRGHLAGNVPVRVWSHIAAVWGPDGVSLFFNGGRIGTFSRLDLAVNGEALLLGNRFPLPPIPADRFAYFGELDVVRIYTRARSAEEICGDANRRFMGGSCL